MTNLLMILAVFARCPMLDRVDAGRLATVDLANLLSLRDNERPSFGKKKG